VSLLYLLVRRQLIIKCFTVIYIVNKTEMNIFKEIFVTFIMTTTVQSMRTSLLTIISKLFRDALLDYKNISVAYKK